MIKCYILKPEDKVVEYEIDDNFPMMGIFIKDKLWFNFDDILQYLGMDMFTAIKKYKELLEAKKDIMLIGVYGTDYTFISEDCIYDICDNDADFEFFIANLYINLKYNCKR